MISHDTRVIVLPLLDGISVVWKYILLTRAIDLKYHCLYPQITVFSGNQITSEESESDATAAPYQSIRPSTTAFSTVVAPGDVGLDITGASVRQSVLLRQSLVGTPLADTAEGSRTTTTADTHDSGGGGGGGGEGSRMSGPNTENDRTSDVTRRGGTNKTLGAETQPSLHLKTHGTVYAPPALLPLWRFACTLTKVAVHDVQK